MTTLLHTINSPAELRRLTPEQLPQVADEVRRMIIETVSRTGGHLASSLGVVELTIALHYVFNTPADRIIWDVGHQCYAHKILTGRRDAFASLRQPDGISGFPKRAESPYDHFDVGHSSTSISAALGMAQSRCHYKADNKVIAVIGDGSLMAGMAFEALNHVGHIKKDLIIILNDNEMSISPNVGAVSSYLSRIITGQAYNRIRNELKSVLTNLPGIGKQAYKLARQSEEFVKSLFVPGLLFDELGLNYCGPVLGNRIDLLLDDLRNIKNLNGPILLHVVTRKGQGYAPAEQNPTRFHGIGRFDPQTGKAAAATGPPSYTTVFGRTLTHLAETNRTVVAITAGMETGTGLSTFAQAFPDRFFDVGIAEQHAVTFAAGMAAEGLRPVVAIYSTFLQRAYDQILHDVCMQRLPVVFVLDRAGIVGEDGPTHHGLFDISYLRAMPNICIMAPRNENELQHMLCTALQHDGPVAIRYPRGSGTGIGMDAEPAPLPVGHAETLRTGTDIALVAIGACVDPACAAAALLGAENISSTVINSRFAKPLDEATLLQCAATCRAVVTVEENALAGGFGSAVLELYSRAGIRTPVHCLGIPDTFVAHGPQEMLRARYDLDATGIARAAHDLLQQ